MAIILLFRLRQGISSGWHHANPTPQLFSDLSVWVKRHYVSASIWTVYLFRANYGNPTAKIFFGSVIIVGRGITLRLRFSHCISSGCQTCHRCTIFLDLSLVLERSIMIRLRLSQGIFQSALFFCFDLARVFLQGDTIPPLNYFLELSLVWEWDMLPLRPRQCIFQGATMPP